MDSMNFNCIWTWTIKSDVQSLMLSSDCVKIFKLRITWSMTTVYSSTSTIRITTDHETRSVQPQYPLITVAVAAAGQLPSDSWRSDSAWRLHGRPLAWNIRRDRSDANTTGRSHRSRQRYTAADMPEHSRATSWVLGGRSRQGCGCYEVHLEVDNSIT